MKRVRVNIVIILISVLIFLSACDNNTSIEIIKWDCSVTIPKNSDQIIFSETVIKTNTGELSVQNQSGIDLTLYLYDSKDKTKAVHQLDMKVGGAGTIYQLDNSVDYCVGIHGNSSTNAEAKIIISNIANPNPY